MPKPTVDRVRCGSHGSIESIDRTSDAVTRPKAIGLAILAVTALLALPDSGAAARADEQDQATPGIVTRTVEPDVERVIRDDQGHALQAKHPEHPRDIDRIAVAPDGTVWIASTARMSDNRFLDGYQVWPVGKPGLYGIEDGVPADIGFFSFMPDGTLWAIGSEMARFDGETWTGADGSHRVVAPDGTLWLLSPRGGLESWDGQAFTSYLRDRQLSGLSVDDEGTLWAFGFGTVASFDGERWMTNDASTGSLTSPDGARWRATGNGVERTLDGERTRYLKGLNINGIALAPDGSVWVAAERRDKNKGGLYRIAPGSGGEVAAQDAVAEAGVSSAE